MHTQSHFSRITRIPSFLKVSCGQLVICLIFGLHTSVSAAPDTYTYTYTNLISPDQMYQLALEAQSARDYPSMMSWLKKAAERDDVKAQEMLGTVLMTGYPMHSTGIKVDRCEALRWMRRAQIQGSAVANFHVQLMNRFQRNELYRKCDHRTG